MHCPCCAVKQEAIVTHPIVKCSFSIFLNFIFNITHTHTYTHTGGQTTKDVGLCATLSISLSPFLSLYVSLSLSLIVPFKTFKFVDCTHAAPVRAIFARSWRVDLPIDRVIDRSNFLCCLKSRAPNTGAQRPSCRCRSIDTR